MFDKIGFDLWCHELKIPERTKAFIENIRNSNPVRRVTSNASNVSGRYCSRKMGVTIQFESHRVELPIVLELEQNKSVLEYYDQPTTIKLNYKSLKGKNVGILYTPDFFVIRSDSAGFEECKTEEELVKLSIEQPNRYSKGQDGNWHCMPAESFAMQYGLYFKVRSSQEINWAYQRNLLFLEDYFREVHEVDELARLAIYSAVHAERGISLANLIKYSNKFTADDIFALIVAGDIYVDLYDEVLAEADKITIYANSDTARIHIKGNEQSLVPRESIDLNIIKVEAGEVFEWDGILWTILNAGISSSTLRSDEGKIIILSGDNLKDLIQSGQIKRHEQTEKASLCSEVRMLLQGASSNDMKVANQRCEIVEQYLAGCKDSLGIPGRTVRRWVANYRKGMEVWNCGYAGLLPKTKNRGNRNSKLPDNTIELIKETVEQDYETKKQKTKYISYSGLVNKCLEGGIVAPSYKTFLKAIKSRPVYEQVLKRQGRRAAYKHESFYMELEVKTPRHGDRPFEICHIDHTELDIELVSSRTGKNYGRPWATFLMDAYSRRILAIYLTYDAPSYRSCMMVIRECVRLHSRMPQTIVVDGGKEFHSTYFETLLARFEVTKKTRPPAKARFGSVCERLFGTANTEFVHNLTGNTQITKNVRQVTKSVNPKGQAIWTIATFYDRICEWAYDFYDTVEHPALGQSPREAFEAALLISGKRLSTMIPYDEEFRIYTLPTTSKGSAKVDPGRGVKIKYIYYWADAFRDPEIEKKQVNIRYDPFDAGTAYAYVKGQWVVCTSEYYIVFKDRTEKEIRIATEEIRKQKNVHGRNFTITAGNIAKFLAPVEEQESQLLQSRKDLETKQVLEVINGGLGKKSLPNNDIKDDKSEFIPFLHDLKIFDVYEEY